jgi:hypothetical protein
MELVGEEKRIQALFSELRAEDENLIRPFAVAWNRARANAALPGTPSRWSVVYASAFLVLMAVSAVVVWRAYADKFQPSGDPATHEVVSPQPGSIQTATLEQNRGSEPPRVVRKKQYLTFLARHRLASIAANRKAARDAAAISKWQSPTMALLHSPSDELFTSLPQLDENASDLKSFLTNAPK